MRAWAAAVGEFYTYRGTSPQTVGLLLNQEPLSPHQSVPGAAVSMRLLYTSTDGIKGNAPIVVSGALFLPPGQAPDGGWPLLLWSHGTVGIADHCAPTWTGYVPFHQAHLAHWLAQGFAIVASDYQGLGTRGIHPYMATQPEAYSNLDIIRAVQGSEVGNSELQGGRNVLIRRVIGATLLLVAVFIILTGSAS